MDSVTLAPAQRTKVKEIDKVYGAKLSALQKSKPSNQAERMDKLNRLYSKALLAVMTKTQQTTYMEAVYTHIQEFLESHPDTKFEDVFVWGGAYAKEPK
jgi:hypothetical protein